jgi:hypothetical protein
VGIANCTPEDFGGNSWYSSDFSRGIGAFLDDGLGEDAQNVIVGLGDAASLGLSAHIRNAISPGSECFVEKDGWYATGGALGFAGSLLTGSAVLGAGMKMIQSARVLLASGEGASGARFVAGSNGIVDSLSSVPNAVALGRFPAYVDLAAATGARAFNLGRGWETMSEAEVWFRNRAFLDDAIAQGSEFLLASSPTAAENIGSDFFRELVYLAQKGISP